jgi:transcriptional regulator with XRE-family HTH domain
VPRVAPPSEVFRRRILEVREKRGLTQAELGERAGLPPAAISHFETGGRKPSFENLVKLAEALRVSTDYLLGRSAEMGGGAELEAIFRDLSQESEEDQDFIRDLLQTRKKRGK